MASTSYESRHKSRLLREMSYNLNRSQSVASSTGSNHGTVSPDSTMTTNFTFNPERDEVFNSTGLFDLDRHPQLPNIRDTAKKYGRWTPRQPEIEFDSSALARAFPNFTQAGPSDDGMFFEHGRAPSRVTEPTPTRLPSHKLNTIRTSRTVLPSQTRMPEPTPTPVPSHTTDNTGPSRYIPLVRRLSQPKLRDSILKEVLINSARKDVPPKKEIIPQNQVTPQKENIQQKEITPQKESTPRKDLHNETAKDSARRVRGPLEHGRIDSIDSWVNGSPGTSGYEAPQKENIAPQPAQRSPYVSNASRTSNGERKSPAELYARVDDGSFIGDERPATVTSQTNNSRFVNGQVASQSANVSKKRPLEDGHTNHTTTSTIPNATQKSFCVPQQTDMSQNTHIINTGIPVVARDGEARYTPQYTPSSRNPLEPVDGILVPDEEEDIYQSLDRFKARCAVLERENARLVVENGNCQREAYELRNGLDELYDSHDLDIQGMRNSHYLDIQELQSQIGQFQHELSQSMADNEDLQRDLAHTTAVSEENDRKWRNYEATLKKKIERQDRAIHELQEITQEIHEKTREIMINTSRKSQPSQKKDMVSRVPDTYREESTSDTTIHHHIGVAPNEEGDTLDGSDYESIVGMQRMRDLRQDLRDIRRIHREVLASAEPEQDNTVEIIQTGRFNQEDDTGRLSTKSIKTTKSTRTNEDDHTGRFSIKTNKSTRIHEDDHTARFSIKTTKSTGGAEKDHTGQFSVKSTKSTGGAERDHRGQFSVKNTNSNGRVEEDATTRSDTSVRHRASSDPYGKKQSNRRPRSNTDDMTSAFIIPDISLIASKDKEHPRLSSDARRVLDGLCKHDCKNCTVCIRVASFDAKPTKESIQIPKPIKVSERMPTPGSYEDEPTLRPAMEPGMALATVIKGVQDEVTHLKLELAEAQAKYAAHDASLGMRHRRELKRSIDNLMEQVETKSDHLYQLYDVLEGQ